jgi:purine catabolism regulator
MVGLELARRAAVLTGRRLLLGQVLEDVVRGAISDEEAARRLDRFGLAGSTSFSVLVGAIPGGEDRLQQITWAVQTLVARRGDPIDTALVEGRLVLIVQGGGPSVEVAQLAYERLHRIASDAAVGIGRTYEGIGGLRRSLLEAMSAVGRGPGVHDALALSLAGSLGLDRSGQAIANAMLAPLVDHDQSTGSDLMRTLVAYLRNDCRARPTADHLALHRNGLAYRLARIEELTGRNLSRLEDRVELVLAARTSGRM